MPMFDKCILLLAVFFSPLKISNLIVENLAVSSIGLT